nr:toll/interleukin-1 receptor domain-containing protein [Streptomyces specialis]
MNYRTGDEEGVATLIERELSRRFGDERVFRASKSIAPGHRFPRELLNAVRRSDVLLVVIGPRWTEARNQEGRRALDDPEDWTRREILEAFESGALVVPVLVGKATRLDRDALPPPLLELADYQYRRLDTRNAEADLTRLANDLADLLPQLAAVDTDRRRERNQETTDRAGNDTAAGRSIRTQTHDTRYKQRGGIGTLNGDLSGTFVNESQGPIHTGQGHQYYSAHVPSDNVNGDHTEMLGRKRRRPDDDR